MKRSELKVGQVIVSTLRQKYKMELIRATSPELFNIGDTLIDISAKGDVFQYTVTEILPDYIIGADIEGNTRLFYNELFPVFLIFKITDLVTFDGT